MATNAETKPNLLRSRFPLAFPDDDFRHYALIPQGFVPALSRRMTTRQVRIVLAVLCHQQPFKMRNMWLTEPPKGAEDAPEGWTRWTIGELAAAVGITTQQVWESLYERRLLEWIAIFKNGNKIAILPNHSLRERMDVLYRHFKTRADKESGPVMVSNWLLDPTNMGGSFIPLSADFARWVYQTLSPAGARTVLDLMQLLDFRGGTRVRISDKVLARRVGLDERNLLRFLRAPKFTALVDVTRGKPWTAGERRQVTTYNLANLFYAFVEAQTVAVKEAA